MKRITKALALALLLGITVTAFSGCRTAKGFGEDMQNAGQAIQDKTDK
jgi:predicted small secreted protein